ncbi:hypothetical protein ACXR2U_02480 [Jatrophihabitans sp. YIM 134969]
MSTPTGPPAPSVGDDTTTNSAMSTRGDGWIEELPDRPQALFNALMTEQFVLQSARSVTVNESSSRAALYLTTLTSTLVAFGFLSRTAYADRYLATVMPVVVILGVFTYQRLVETSLEDIAALAAIQNIRQLYRKLVPDAADYFVVPDVASAANEMFDIGRRRTWVSLLFTVSSGIAVVNSIVAAAGVAVLVDTTHVHPSVVMSSGAVTAVALVAAHLRYQERRYRAVTALVDASRSPSTRIRAGNA